MRELLKWKAIEGVGLHSLVASLVSMTYMRTFYKNIHATQSEHTIFDEFSKHKNIESRCALEERVHGIRLNRKNRTNFTVREFCLKVFEAAIKTQPGISYFGGNPSS